MAGSGCAKPSAPPAAGAPACPPTPRAGLLGTAGTVPITINTIAEVIGVGLGISVPATLRLRRERSRIGILTAGPARNRRTRTSPKSRPWSGWGPSQTSAAIIWSTLVARSFLRRRADQLAALGAARRSSITSTAGSTVRASGGPPCLRPSAPTWRLPGDSAKPPGGGNHSRVYRTHRGRR